MGLNKHICNCCGKEYENYFKESKYCSTDCYDNFRKSHAKLVEKECPVCGEFFKPRNSDVICCSRKCAGIRRQNRVSCVCEYCGKNFTRIKSEVEKNSKHFCSNECRQADLRWSVEDEQVLRDNYGKLSYKEISNLLSRNVNFNSIGRKVVDMGIVKHANIWSDDEIDILINNYSIKPMNEVLELLPGRSQSAILHQARNYDLKSYFYINRSYSDDEIQYIMQNYIDKSYEEMSCELGRTVTAIKIRMYILGLRKPTEISNYNNLYNYVRQRIVPWRNNVRESHGYICEISGCKSNIIVHHIRSFNLLIEECVDILDFPLYDDFSQYSQEQLDVFVETFLELQEYYGAYVCISESIHKQFHKIYGYGNNTQEQWNEFVLNYSNT